MHLFHKWSKWQQYEHYYTIVPSILFPKEIRKNRYNGADIRQKRFCLECGKMQDELVSEGVGLSKESTR